jgi:hypothetical protein
MIRLTPKVRHLRFVLALALMVGLGASASFAQSWSGTLLDAASKRPISGAVVTSGTAQAMTDKLGKFSFASDGAVLRIRALGYQRLEITGAHGTVAPILELAPILPKALYFSIYGIGVSAIRDPAFQILADAGLNAVVIDLKGDGGQIPYPSSMALAAQTGALKVKTISSLTGLVKDLKARGLYAIARIVVFKDPLLAAAKPEWAVHNSDGSVWKDSTGLSWIDPFQEKAWSYALGVAEEAAAAGFDEIQFDYIRFPDSTDVSYSQHATEDSRIVAIDGFLDKARQQLRPYNVFIGVDVFGYICWNRNDTHIGQHLEDLATRVDYISPMLYPSGFQFGIPGHRDPVADPYDIVYDTLSEAQRRTAGMSVLYRPWLQAFRDYAFDRRKFGDAEIRAQVLAAHDAGSAGWMLWNPRNVYSTDGLLDKQAAANE